ncbi:MAG: hypothetical protein LAO08_07970 [Acidobacteriia bacterium]|nr:hypothetical protein [Terriglobia bacterium]
MNRSPAISAPGSMAAFALLMFLLGLCVPQASAQAWHSGKVRPTMTVYSTLDGSYSSSGSVIQMSNDVGYNFSPLLGMDAVVPVYFVLPPAQKSAFSSATTGIGNFAVDGRLSLSLLVVDYQPTATIAFPTGSATKGFSTGTVTYDIDNHFERDLGLITPFLDIDVGNSLNNGSRPGHAKVQRPYLTLGKVAEFTVGPQIQLFDRWSVSGDVYQVVPWGTQMIYSRILRPGSSGAGGRHNRVFEIAQRTVGGAKLVSDDGYDASVEFSPTRYLDLTAAFDRSIHYALNTLTFSAGFNLTEIFSRNRE